MDQGREVCPELGEIVMQEFCLEPGEACAFRTGLQSGQLSSTTGSATENQTLVIAHSSHEVDKDRCESGKVQQVYNLSDGRGGNQQEAIC